MNRISTKRLILSLVLSIALIAAMALLFVSCDKEQTPAPEAPATEQQPEQTEEVEEVEEVGSGSTTFSFFAQFADGSVRKFNVKTDKTTVGEALVDAGLISGAESTYGLMVDTVCGVRYDYTEHGMYWSFYVNDSYANTGVDSTPIAPNEAYSFRAVRA